MSPFGNASLESQCPVGPLESVAKTWSLHAVVLCTIPCIIHYNGAPSLVRYSGTELLLILLGLGPCSMAKNMAKNAKKAKNMAKKSVGYV